MAVDIADSPDGKEGEEEEEELTSKDIEELDMIAQASKTFLAVSCTSYIVCLAAWI